MNSLCTYIVNQATTRAGSMRPRNWGSDRAQTQFDFLVAIGLFLLVIGFTFAFVPGLLDPYQPNGHGNSVKANRGADHLTQNVLRADGAPPYVLDRDCTVAFFDGTAASACPVSSNELPSIIGLGAHTHANVSLLNPSTNAVATLDGTRMTVGDSTAGAKNVYKATRVVTISGNRYTFVYRVW